MKTRVNVRKSCILPVRVPLTGLVHVGDRDELGLARKLAGQSFSLLVSSTYISRRITELAQAIIHKKRIYNNDALHLLIVLKGAAFFGCRLAQEIFRMNGPNIIINFVGASSYGKTTSSSGHCRITGSLNMLRKKNVVVVEDICDTGLTLSSIKKRLSDGGNASSVNTCVLLDKPGNRLARFKKTAPDFIGFKIPAIFIAGFGMDHAERLRELPFIVAVSEQG